MRVRVAARRRSHANAAYNVVHETTTGGAYRRPLTYLGPDALKSDVTGRGPSFLTGALVLVAGSLFSRVLGATYRLILPILMGGGQQAAVGMGLFQLAYPIFTVLVTLITTGFPLAVSKLVAERLASGDRRGAARVFADARAGLPLFGLALALLLWSVAPWVADHVAGDPRAILTIRAVAPAIFTVSLASAYRGAFQGMEDMVPYAWSQVVEQVGRVLTMFVLVSALMSRGIQWAAAGASFGAVVGGLCAWGALRWLWPRRGAPRLRPGPGTATGVGAGARTRPRGVLKEILQLAVPIALAATLLPLLNVADAAIVPIRLRAAGLGADATALYGVLTGYAAPLVLAPTVFTSALAMSLLPAISSALAAGDLAVGRARAAAGLRLTTLLCLPAAAGLMLLAGPLPRALFHSTLATAPLLAMAPALVFLSLQQASSGILQGLGRPDLPMRHLALGGALKVAVSWLLVGDPRWNISGAALGTTLAFVVACTLNLRAVARQLPGAVDLAGMAAAPLEATGAMAAVLLPLLHVLHHHALVSVGAGVVVGPLVYAAVLLVLGGVRRSDLDNLPGVGARLSRVPGLVRWLRA